MKQSGSARIKQTMIRATFRAAVVIGMLAATVVARGEDAAKPPVLAGSITDGQEKALKQLGEHGCLIVRTAGRWDNLQRTLIALGWKRPEGKHELSGVDFEKQIIVGVFKRGWASNAFSVRRCEAGELDVLMSYVLVKKPDGSAPAWNFIFVAVPKPADKLNVSVLTYHPLNGGKWDTPQKARLEWASTFTDGDGDIVDGLTGRIDLKEKTVKAGGDILVAFTLALADRAKVEDGQFARPISSLQVWDGKYSEGYRNSAYLAGRPGGETAELRAEEHEWRKNIPHPEEISAKRNYELPGSEYGTKFVSLKGLGLDTSKPGKQTITGLWQERAQEAEGVRFWGGDIATNTVTVEITN